MKKSMISLITVAVLAAVGLSFSTHVSAATKKDDNYAITTRQVKAGKVTLPANTRVFVWYKSTRNHQTYASIDLLSMSYRIRHTTKATSITIPYSHNLKTVKGRYPNPICIGKGHQLTTQSAWTKTPKLTFTADNRVEYFANGNFDQKPISSTMITKTKQKGHITYYYAKKNMLKLPDKRISKTGNYQYRLTVQRNKVVLGALSISYSVGSSTNYFYAPTLNA
ncbi:hypothetical protein [Secundilactobacillus silagei]|uniref:Extracellular protein n=1 Tax=Secundilactobacillus silagei JCM 19001 TaxID=1302250 RepID=A0A1Z5IJ70_9LACO|nr:hypothetical protein [Secundilactobacillus silagei]TDG73114.1 hypothetical protein C5L25_000755 [Secundilactobacillus silagei JCM 19001]GAX01481.1 hypothetical protein IWT126_01522 [Secundilactobacillus silagei JCM 19001]